MHRSIKCMWRTRFSHNTEHTRRLLIGCLIPVPIATIFSSFIYNDRHYFTLENWINGRIFPFSTIMVFNYDIVSVNCLSGDLHDADEGAGLPHVFTKKKQKKKHSFLQINQLNEFCELCVFDWFTEKINSRNSDTFWAD